MAIKKVTIGDKEVTFVASAATPRQYRFYTGRDILKDMVVLSKKLEKTEDEDEQLMMVDFQMFEDIVFTMAKKENGEASAEEWLEQFEIFSIYEVFPVIFELWTQNMETTTPPSGDKKK